MFNLPGHLLFVLWFSVPDSQLTSQPFHAPLRLEQVAEHTLQVVLQRPGGRGRRGCVVGGLRGIRGWHHHHHLRLFGWRVDADKLLPSLPQWLQQEGGGNEHGQRQDDHSQRHDEQLEHERLHGQQYGYLGQEQRGYGRYHGLDQTELGCASRLQ